MGNTVDVDFTGWTWFDYHVQLDKIIQYNTPKAYALAQRYEKLGIPFHVARWVGFPPNLPYYDGKMPTERIGAHLQKTLINFDGEIRRNAIDYLEELITVDGLSVEDAVKWTEFGEHFTTIDELRELIAAGDIDPVEGFYLHWQERWSFDYVLHVLRNRIDVELARTLYTHPSPVLTETNLYALSLADA